MLYEIKLDTEHNGVHELTEQVKNYIRESGVVSGTCTIFTPHTTAALTITSFWDPKGFEDLQDEICRLVPTRIDFKHQFDTPSDAAGHVKSALVGVGLPLIIHKAELFVGHSQGIYFLEFDGPRKRQVYVKVQKDPE